MKLRARTSVVGTITASLALALAGPALAVNAAADASSAVAGAALVRFPEFAGLTDSRSLQDPLMLQGKLTDVAGKALSGAQVLLAAWPSSSAVAKLPVGGSFDVVPAARTIAGKDGAYQLRSLITPLLMSLSGKDGLDVELDVFHGDRHYVYLTQLKSGGGNWIHDFVRGVDGQAGELTSKATNSLDLALDPAQGEKLSKDLVRGARIPVANEPLPGGAACGKWYVFATTSAMTTAATAVARNQTTAVTSYGEDATTTTSTGFSIGGAGEFKINGARSRTSGTGAEWNLPAKKKQTLARDYLVQVEHDTLERKCFGNKYGEYRHQYVTSPSRIVGGFDNVPSRFPLWNCTLGDDRTALAHASKVWTTTSKAVMYEKAFTFFPFDGAAFTGRAASDYSEHMQITFFFADKDKGQWCGSTGLPRTPGQRVQGFQL
ncbi:hypothetical protein [Sporichthya sp.]|uniref:hypothetical protein n=1 Tax=Sporichthya sp. TaxID=65475 RepID=UPI001794C480|nr:hypothetical protein [Sporichthya sp.]MBA3743762.1 hypothetical protein [Sporichthya sp.]